MKILALESSTSVGGAALWAEGQVVGEELSATQRAHSEVLNVFVEKLLRDNSLTLSQIDGFAVGQGPGSFTGIRVASNAGRTFAYLQNKPLITIDSLTLLAEQVRGKTRPVFAMINAYKNMVYFAHYDVRGFEPILVEGPIALPLGELGAKITRDVTVVGDGWTLLPGWLSPEKMALLHREDGVPDEPRPSTLARVAARHFAQGRTLDWKSFSPLYLRASEAEENQRGRVFKS